MTTTTDITRLITRSQVASLLATFGGISYARAVDQSWHEYPQGAYMTTDANAHTTVTPAPYYVVREGDSAIVRTYPSTPEGLRAAQHAQADALADHREAGHRGVQVAITHTSPAGTETRTHPVSLCWS